MGHDLNTNSLRPIRKYSKIADHKTVKLHMPLLQACRNVDVLVEVV